MRQTRWLCVLFAATHFAAAAAGAEPDDGPLAGIADESPVAATPAGSPTRDALDRLVAQLPDRHPTGTAIGEVILLGVRSPATLEGYAQEWLLPVRPRFDALERELLAALRQRFPTADRVAPGGVEGAAAQLLAFESDREGIGSVNRKLGVDAAVAVQFSQSFGWPATLRVEARLYGGRSAASTFEHTGHVEIPDALAIDREPNPRTVVVLVLALALLLPPLLRGKGTIVVSLACGDAEPGIVYTAYVSLRALKDDPKGKLVLSSNRVVDGEYEFQSMPTRKLHVSLRRVQRDPKTLVIESNSVVDKIVEVTRRGRVVVKFDMTSKGVLVALELVHGKDKPVAGQAVVGVEGSTEPPRYFRDGKGTLHLDPRLHTLLVGFRDRAFEVPVRVKPKAREMSVRIDVDLAEKAFFDGCPAAVVPFVNRDWSAAASALEAAGQTEPAALLRARVHRAKGEASEAATALESAGRLREAAQLRATTGDAEGTAALLERAEDWRGAGEQYASAGDMAAAVRAFVRGQCWDDALRCAFQSGDRSLAVTVLEKKGDRLEASQMCLELDDSERATSLLQGISLSDPRYGEACLLLAQLFNTRDEPELALQKLDEAVGVFGSETSLELREQIAMQLERKGNLQLALEACEHIRKRDIGYPGMAEKIESLRSRLRAPDDATMIRGSAARAGVVAAPEASRYELLDEIGRGGMGVVYRARDRVLGRIVAYKRLPEALKQHETAVRFFMREAQSAAALNHPNIVTLYDAGQEGGEYYLTMELLKGLPLNDVLARKGRLDVRNVVRIGIQVADGLAYAHAEGIVHRDIKPSNLLLTKSSRVKIMDFGLAKAVEEVRRKATLIAGTPHYMAPEQAIGDVVDQRVDLYAFGVTLYELAAGEVPFPHGDATYHRLHTPPPDLRERVADAPPALAKLLLELMAKEADERPASAAATRDRLQAILQSSS